MLVNFLSTFPNGNLSLQTNAFYNLYLGKKIEFDTPVPLQTVLPNNSISKEHQEQVKIEIESLLQKGVLINSDHEPGEFISPIFYCTKK